MGFEIVIAVPLLICIVCFFGGLALNRALFRPEKGKREPEVKGACKVIFQSGKNRLAGYLWNENGTRGLLVFAHGMGTDINYYLPELSHFASCGYRVLAFSYSGYPGSTGEFRGFSQAVTDVKNALDFIDDGTLPIVLAGHSMGAYAVCAVLQATHPISAIVAYAPFYSPREAIYEIAHRQGKYGGFMYRVISSMQMHLFGKRANLNAADGLLEKGTPALILQGSADREVTWDGCSLYAHRRELAGTNAEFYPVTEPDSNGHMTVIRKTGEQGINENTMATVDAFLKKVLP